MAKFKVGDVVKSDEKLLIPRLEIIQILDNRAYEWNAKSTTGIRSGNTSFDQIDDFYTLDLEYIALQQFNLDLKELLK